MAEVPPLEAGLVSFATTLTSRPWDVGPADIRQLSAAGLSDKSIVLVVGLVAMFNYLTRVADGTGIEADYGGTLPEFTYRGLTDSVARPGPELWPPVDRSLPSMSLLTGLDAAWGTWREYVCDSSVPISRATRNRLRWITARNACDAGVDPPGRPDAEPDSPLARFADTLSRTPWLIGQPDVDELRATGLDDLAVLHVIATVAYQSAESRLRIGLSALARAQG